MTDRPHASSRPPRSPLTRVLDFFSSVRLGIVLLVILFVYSWIGSAGLVMPYWGMPRQWRIFEMTEFEWFHTWFFIALCLLIAANITITTLRRIPLNLIKLGPWIIHTGILIMIAGCLIYFGRKIEGDTLVGARKIVVSVEGSDATLDLVPVAGDGGLLPMPDGGQYSVRVMGVHPDWPLATLQGESAFVVDLSVRAPDGTQFVRQLFRDTTANVDPSTFDQDIVIDAEGRFQRAKTALGRPLVDEALTTRFEPTPQDTFWLKDSAAIYVRRATPEGGTAWSETPLEGLPRYNDYAKGGDLAPWPSRHAVDAARHDLSIELSGFEPGHPLARAQSVRITGYLRYATLDQRYVEAGAEGVPVARLVVQNPNERGVLATLPDAKALDPGDQAALVFWWVGQGDDPEEGVRQMRERGWRALVIAGPSTPLRVINQTAGGAVITMHPALGESITMDDGASLMVERVMPSAIAATRPVIIPSQQREQGVDQARLAAMIRVEVRWTDTLVESAWLPYNQFVSDDPLLDRMSRVDPSPAFFMSPDGPIELRFSRERMALPAPVRLDRFVVTEHEGGFTGETLSIRDWTSEVTFAPGESGAATASISTNDPGKHRGFWYFQASWDPPAGRGLALIGGSSARAFTYTGLGVGNRHGVWTMLIGATIAVLGMIYAFYIKPVIRRRRLVAAMARVEAGAHARANGSGGAGELRRTPSRVRDGQEVSS